MGLFKQSPCYLPPGSVWEAKFRSSMASSPFSITSFTSSPTSLIAVILASVFRGCSPVTQLWWPPGQDTMEMDTVDLARFSEAQNPEKKKGLRGTCFATFDLSLTVMALCIKRDRFRQMGRVKFAPDLLEFLLGFILPSFPFPPWTGTFSASDDTLYQLQPSSWGSCCFTLSVSFPLC